MEPSNSSGICLESSGICLATLDQLINAVNRKYPQHVSLTADLGTKEEITIALNGVVVGGPPGPGREEQIIAIYKEFFPVSWELEQKKKAEKLAQEEKTRKNVARRKEAKVRRAIERAEVAAKAEAEAEAKAKAEVEAKAEAEAEAEAEDAPASEPPSNE